jgi:hypothetical protein
MQESSDVRGAVLRFYDRLSANDASAFDDLVSRDPALLIIGTAPGDWFTDRERIGRGFEAEGVRIEPGPRPTGYQVGSAGWVIDEPTFFLPDGSPVSARMTAIVRREDGAWKVIHMHFSVGVPDAEVAELQRRWSPGG